MLFVCHQNAGRSQMAQAFFTSNSPEDLRAESAGDEPADQVHPPVVEAMLEVGIDLSRKRPQKLTVEMQLHADWGVTMGCGDACPYVPASVEDWEVPDPADKPLAEVRAIRDGIAARVEELIVNHAEDIRSNDSAHKARLARLLPSLIDEFGEVREPQEIRACADAVLCRYDDVPIRSHILTFAHRRATTCLREQTCSELVAGR